MRRLGILGGTFNPVHYGHLRIAATMSRRCELDQLVFIPAATPPHKDLDRGVSYADRAAMVAAAIADHPQWSVSDIEAQRAGKSYSVDTLRQLRRLYPESELFFLVGMDSFRDLDSWRDYPQIFALAHLVVAARPGVDCRDLRRFLPVAVRGKFCYDDPTRELRHSSGHRVILLSETAADISSSEVRTRLAQGAPVDALVPPPVAAYIATHQLYRNKEGSDC